jgi:hypothetical protein
MVTRTITVDQYADDGTTVEGSGGDVLTVNGGTITFRRDSRRADGVNSTIGGNSVISATLGGGIRIDATQTRWLPVSSSSGTLSIGATITQGGVSGSFLGFWSSLTARGSTTLSGAGFIKFREVTGGTFAAGALSGVTATASGPDVVGWIEIVADQAANFNVPRLGNFTTRGDWFELDATTGADGQLIQTPTQGSATTYAPGIWIETGVGTGEYEFYSAIYSTGFSSTNFGNDERCKVVKMGTDGTVQIGNGAGVGYVPPAGCRTRIPNVIMRQCTTAARQTNAIPHASVATRPDFTTTNAGVIDIQYSYNDWYLLFAQPFAVTIKHTATHEGVKISECASPLDIDDGGAGSSAGLALAGGYFTSCFAGGTINNWVFSGLSNALSGGICSFAFCIGQRVTNCKVGCWTYARSATKSFGFYTSQCTDIQFNDCASLNCSNELLTSFQCEVNNFDYCDRYVGATNTTTGLYCWIVTASCDTVKIDGVTFGQNGAIADVHPYNGIVSYAASSNLKFRNFGTRAAFLNGGSANNPAYIAADGGNNLNVKIQRCYMQPTRTGALSSNNSSKNMLFEDVYGDWADAQTQAGLNLIVRGGGGTNSVTGQASVYGTHFGGSFQSDTVGRMWLAMNEPTAETLQYCTTSFSPGSGFTSAGGLSLATAGDYYICEMQEARLQTTGFRTTAVVVTGTNAANHDIEYQLDNGSGWNGVWKTFDGTTLATETIYPNIGYKLKIRVTCNTSNNANLISYIRCSTSSTLQAQLDNLYPLDQNSVSFTGLPTGYDAVVLTAGTTTVLEQVDNVNSTTYTYNYSGAQTVDVGFIKPGYVPFYIRNLSLTTTDSSIPVSLTADRNYA